MAVSKRNYNIELQSFCDMYITIDSKGEIDFKSVLKDAIENNSISMEDARLISLELMYDIKNYNLKEEKIHDQINELIKKVEGYNLDGEISLKMGALFFKDYTYEENFILQYVNGTSVNVDELDEISNYKAKSDSKSFKDGLKHLSREDLCYILDLNPELNFENVKPLKNRIIDKYSKFLVDIDKVEDASAEEIKKYLSSLSGNEIEEISNNEENIAVSDNEKDTSSQLIPKTETDKEKRKRLTELRKQKNKLFLEEQRRKRAEMKKIRKQKDVIKPKDSQKNQILSVSGSLSELQPEDNPKKDIGTNKNQNFGSDIREIDKSISSRKIKRRVYREKFDGDFNQIILKNFPSGNPKEYQLKAVSEIIDAIEEGYKYVIFEAEDGFGKSEIALTLANISKNSLILRANEQLKNQFIKRFKNKIDSTVSVSNYYEFFKNQESYGGNSLLIMEEAHILDQFVVNYISNESEDNAVPFKIDDYVKNILNNNEICIFIGSSILNPKQFLKEFGIDDSDVKFIHKNFSYEFKNKIHTRNSVNMKYQFIHESAALAIPIIEDILDKHKSDRGIIFADNNKWKNYVLRDIGGSRLLDNDIMHAEKVRRFKSSTNNVLVCSSVEDYFNLPTERSKFLIVFRQPMPLWDDRAKLKDRFDSNWYNYKKATDIVPMLRNRMNLRHDDCDVYIIDERFQLFIINDMEGPNFIPQHIRDSIVDMDLVDYGNVSGNIKKKYGIHYIHDYIPDGRISLSRIFEPGNKMLNKEIQNYKDYQYDLPDFNEEFEFFTNEVMKAICEFSKNIISPDIDRIALVSIPSSTLERDKYNSMRSTINYIEDNYKSGKLKNQFGCKKDIINCGELLIRIEDVKTSHSDERRSYYCEHIDSIRCNISQISDLSNVAFIILDDIATRGTVMNACEDILIKNNIKKENIYKFALFKTIGVENEKV